MNFFGGEKHTQGELIGKMGLAPARAKDITRVGPGDTHKPRVEWASGLTIAPHRSG